MAVQILPPISRTPGAQDDYPFFILNPDGSARDITNDFIEVIVGNDEVPTIFTANSGDPAKVEKDDPLNGGWTLHVVPDSLTTPANTQARYQVRLTPSATAPGAASVVIGEGTFTIKAPMFEQPSFTVVPEQTAVSLAPGGSTSFGVIVGSVGSFAGTVDLAALVDPIVVNGPLAGITTPATVPSGLSDTETLSITTVPATPLGTYTITITGTAGALTRTATVILTVA